jgi:hypothetical protein
MLGIIAELCRDRLNLARFLVKQNIFSLSYVLAGLVPECHLLNIMVVKSAYR